MKLLERLLVTTGELVAAPYLKAFNERSPEKVLKNSMQFLDDEAIGQLKAYVNKCFSESGGFRDRAGKPDLYYSLFGYYIAKALEKEEIFPSLENFVQQKIKSETLPDVYMHCAAIIIASESYKTLTNGGFKSRVIKSIREQLKTQKIYNAFLSLLTCYYIRDFSGIYFISKYLTGLELHENMPCSVTAAGLVLQKTFNRPVEELVKQVYTFYDQAGGFKATKATKSADLLSTAVALYALNFAGADLRMIRAQCLEFVDSLFIDGGFSANHFDPDTDIEYTFYGLLALGALAA